MSKITGRFSPVRIMVGTLLMMLTAVVFGSWALATASVRPYQFMIPVLMIEALLVIKWAAPDLPSKQLAFAVGLILIIQFLSDQIPILNPLFDKLIQLMCVAGFGASWVRRGYIPKSANRW